VRHYPFFGINFSVYSEIFVMPWTEKNYPRAMESLPADVRRKAIEIANALLEETKMNEGIAIATAISRGKDWAANRGKQTEKKSPKSKRVDVKQHGEDRHVTPAEEGWKVVRERGGRPEVFNTKKEAVEAAKEEAREANASVTIHRKDGKMERRVSYNPNKRAPAQG
jgi:uncharacterized protein YdaT